jgi:hypothetical protein
MGNLRAIRLQLCQIDTQPQVSKSLWTALALRCVWSIVPWKSKVAHYQQLVARPALATESGVPCLHSFIANPYSLSLSHRAHIILSPQAPNPSRNLQLEKRRKYL